MLSEKLCNLSVVQRNGLNEGDAVRGISKEPPPRFSNIDATFMEVLKTIGLLFGRMVGRMNKPLSRFIGL